jgi:hypothetical protein
MNISICAHCERDHVLTILTPGVTAERALHALEEGEVSHGICKPHEATSWAEIERWKAGLKTVLASAALVLTLALPVSAAPHQVISAEEWAKMLPEQQVLYIAGSFDALNALGLRCPATKTYGEYHRIMRGQITRLIERGKRLNLISGAESLIVNLRAQGCVFEDLAK